MRCLRFSNAALFAAGVITLACGGGMAARADHAPSFVVPGRAGVPVIIDGVDASWGVVEGDWGLHRPGFVSPVVTPAWPTSAPYRSGGYFPSAGRAPVYGRREIEPPADRVLPPRAPAYYRNWSSESAPAPATIESGPPPVIIAPEASRRRRHHHP